MKQSILNEQFQCLLNKSSQLAVIVEKWSNFKLNYFHFESQIRIQHLFSSSQNDITQTKQGFYGQ